MKNFFEIYITYDLNLVCQRMGPLYNSFYNTYYNLQGDLPRKHALEDYTRAELIHLLVLLICSLQNLDCPDLFYIEIPRPAGKTMFEHVHVQNKKWFATLIKHRDHYAQTINNFVTSEHKVEDIIENMTTFNTELLRLETGTMKLREKYEESLESEPAPQGMAQEKEKVFKDIKSILESVQENIYMLKQYEDKAFD